jgi:hypothetical protein
MFLRATPENKRSADKQESSVYCLMKVHNIRGHI